MSTSILPGFTLVIVARINHGIGKRTAALLTVEETGMVVECSWQSVRGEAMYVAVASDPPVEVFRAVEAFAKRAEAAVWRAPKHADELAIVRAA